METINTVKEYGIPDGNLVGSFGLDKLDDVIMELFDDRDDILRIAETGETLEFKDFVPYHVTGTAQLYENALVIKLQEHNDQNAKHEDAGKSELYVFDDEIVYIVTEVDPKLNKVYKINQDEVREYKEKLGNSIEIPEELKSATTFGERISFFFSSGKRKKQKARRDYCLNKIDEYMSKLLNIDIESE